MRPATSAPNKAVAAITTWLQGGGQATLEIQVMEFADARGQGSRVDLH
jgi:hypothetical protein